MLSLTHPRSYTHSARKLMFRCAFSISDDSMHYLYNTPLVKCMEDWLDSYDVDLLTTGVLALGNFARTDSHCIEMVKRGVTKKLLCKFCFCINPLHAQANNDPPHFPHSVHSTAILSENNGTEDEMRLQHALLSALRNLVIPKENKPIMIEAGLVQTILPMLEIHQPPVVFKLLGTLRMTVDGQIQLAHELLCNAKLIAQLVHWSKSSDYSSVSGESYRLMAWLVKHAYKDSTVIDTTVAAAAPAPDAAVKPKTSTNGMAAVPSSGANAASLKAFITTDGAVDSMATMLTSQHLVMQNEALIALCLISSVFMGQRSHSDVNLDELFIKCDLGGKLIEFINHNADTMTKEIVENVQTLIALLRVSATMVKHLNEKNLDAVLKTIPILTEYCTL